MSTYPAESFYRGTIRQSIANNTSVPFTLKVSKIPTLTSGLLTVSPNTANEELIEYSGVDGTALTITVVKRGISPSAQALTVNGTDYNNVTYQKSHSQNDTIRGDVNHLHIIQDYGNLSTSKLDKSGGLRDTMGASRQSLEIDATGAEVKKTIIDGTVVLDSDTLRKRKADGTYEEIPFLSIKTALSSAGKYVQSIPLGEDIAGSTPTAISVIRGVGANAVPTLTSNSGNPAFIASMVLFSGTAFQCFDNNIGTSCSSPSTGSTWELRLDMTTAVALSYGMTCSGTNTSADLYMSHTGSGGAFSLQGSNDGTSWTTIQSFSGNDGAGNPVPGYVPAQSVAWLKYRLTGVVPSGAVGVYNWNFRFGGTTIQPIVYSNTMGGNIAGGRVKSGIRFSVPYATTLGTVKTSQVSTSVNARVQLFQDDGTTLVAEQTPSSSDTVVFPNTPLTANTIYKLVLNDSTYFGGNNNELALATYQTGCRFAVSGTLNANDTVLPQNIKEVQLGTFKAMKSIANSTIEYSTLGGFIVGPKSKGDLITLDANENTLVGGFSGLVPNFTYHIANTAGTISLATGTTKSPVGYPVSSTELFLTKRQSDTIKNLGNIAGFNHFGGSVYVNFLFGNFATGQSVTFVGRTSITIYGSYVTGATAGGGYTATVELPPGEYKVIYNGTSSASITIAH